MFYIISALVLVSALAIFLFINKKKKLDEKSAKSFANKIQRTSKLAPNHSLLESHKILVSSIEAMYSQKLTAAKALNKVIKRLPEEKEIWRFHRMRNQAAHELDYKITDADAKAARKLFKAAVKALSA